MAYDLEEQEQLASLKAFWAQYGNIISWIAIAGMASYAAYNYWNFHQRDQAGQASALYEQLQKEIAGKDKDSAKIMRIASDIEGNYGRTAYAQMSALTAAKAAFDKSDLKTAKAQLQWAIDNGNDEYKSIAKLRLSGVLLDEKAYDDGLKLLAGEFMPQFASEVAERKGDILVAQNKVPEARVAYQAALDAADKSSPGRQIIQLKLDAIGGASTPAPKAAA